MFALPKLKPSVIGFVLLYVAFCLSYIDRAAISIALAQIGKDFNLQASDLAIGTITMWSVFTVTTSFAWSLLSLIAIRFAFGIAEGGFPPAAIKAVSESFAKDDRPKMSALLISSNYAGSMIAPLIMAPLIIWLGWRHAFEVI